MHRLQYLVIAALGAGCIDPATDKGAESALPGEGAADSFQKPTEHGAIGFDATATARLLKKEQHHTWTFALTGDAEVDLVTGPPSAGGPEVDTVLYLYKRKPAGNWGSWIARNDDADGTLWSSVTRDLGAGEYRVLVKGYSSATRGDFAVTVGCAGAGCVAAPSDECLLGTTYHELMADPGFAPLYSAKIYDAATLSPLQRDQVILAVHQSSHTDVVTIEEAFAAVDQGEINVTELQHVTTGQILRAYEYGAGDNSYGAVIYGGTLVLAASIRDGDLYDCTFVARPAGPIPGEGASCTSDPACGDTRLICAGLTRAEVGQCLPLWMRGTFDDVAGGVTIPDAGTLRRDLTVFGLATVDTDVELRATIAHPKASQLLVYLQNPATAEVLVWDGPARGADADADSYAEIDGPVRFSGDEQVNGTWTLRIVDLTGGEVGTLSDWHLTVTSRWD